MARLKAGAAKQPAKLTPDQMESGIKRLRMRLDELEKFDPTGIASQYDIPEVDHLSAAIDDALVRTFGSDTIEYDRYRYGSEFDNGPHNYAFAVPISEVHQSLARSKASNIALLKQAIASLEERLNEASAFDMPGNNNLEAARSRKIFVVHGHDEGAREAIARFLERIEYQPIILHEQANRGRTVIEKVEAHGDVDFDVVLLTPDDEGCKKGGVPAPPRAPKRHLGTRLLHWTTRPKARLRLEARRSGNPLRFRRGGL